MVGNAGAGVLAHQALHDRLSPAEAHDIIRQRLDRLAVPWGLTSADVHHLARKMRAHTYASGEIILPFGVHADCFGLVVRGQVAVYTVQRKGARPVVVLLPGSTFGEAMLTEGRSSPATLQALTRCEIRFLCHEEFEALVSERQTERRVALLKRLGTWGTLALALWFAALLLLILPGTRRTLALVPMSIGQLCHQRGYDTCSERAWTVAANLSPADANPLLALGALFFEQGQIGAAEQYFEAAGSLAPGLPEVFNNLGLIYAHQGDHQRAVAAFRRALELEPGVAAVEHNLACSLQALHAHEEALAHYQLALSLGGPRASTLVNMAIAYYEADEPVKAADAAREALRYDEALAPAYTVLAAVALESGQPEEALTYLHRAAALDANYDQAHFYLGLTYKSLSQPGEAIVAFEQALATADDEVARVRIRRHLNELYEAERQDGTP